ncbi:G patch domain-containing protein 3-like isoform X1 [Amphibalanus amphitrite]|uniref:G patch domain-containing protein 3-like isoform X1 n=1 Tax=Amphibalanus amphitrite TaxID=1232801 RepID=UPI001C8FA785|nr:G patch domain-containing protein 3-like isoform X1 [Amphibalanus amphitrite]
MTEALDSEVICIVHNIPKTFHSRDLRNYFSQFLEKGGFTCFHYRHRPEVQQTSSDAQQPAVSGGEVSSLSSDTIDLSAGQASGPSGGEVGTGHKPQRSHVACCATLKLPGRHLAEFLSLYHRKHWVDSGGSYLSRRCFISRLRLPAGPDGGASPAAAELQTMIEFRPPADMPRGNVGTPTAYFLAEIQKCRLPASLVKRLGLVFPRSARRRQYSSVPLDYGTAPVSSEDLNQGDDEVRTASGAELLDRLPSRPGAAAASEGKQQPPEPPRASDETDAEETDRHEALHDDVTSQDRTKERLYEEEIELVWEKGGPGLVWYTDAVYWDQQRGDFDERTSDDWDVDMSGYEQGAGHGDMDAQQSHEMRRELRLRAGQEAESAFERGRDRRARGRRTGDGSDSDEEMSEIGAFERHTRGFGRRVLVNLGWSEGRGLGAGEGGIAEPLPNAGQTDRRGFGFVGERLQRWPERKRRAESAAGVVTTAFSDPHQTEMEETTDASLPPTHMKFRRQQE